MKLCRYWTRTTAVVVLISGVVFAVAAALAAIFGSGNAGATFDFLIGIVVGVSVAMLAVSIWWLIKWRGLSDEEIRVNVSQENDERRRAASARAGEISGLVTAFCLLACACVFFIRQESLVGWLFMGGAYIAIFGRVLLTRILLR